MNELLRRLLFLPPQASSVARSIDTLHYVVIGITMAGALATFAVVLIFLIRYRARPGISPSPNEGDAKRSSRAPLEIAVLAALLALFIVFWVVGQRQYAELAAPPEDAMTIYVTAKQWMWKFSYPDGRSAVDVLTVPQGTPVRLVMTSRDVIHSFYVPAFRVKQDVLPQRFVSTWFTATVPGAYEIWCAEYCGTSHSRMRGAVLVLPPDRYAAWLQEAPRGGGDPDNAAGATDLAAHGREVAVRHACFACHTVDGQPHVGPTWSRLFGSSVVLEDGRTETADEAYLTRSMMDPNKDIVRGYRAVMPTYQGTLEGPEAAALVEYIKTLRDGPIAPSVTLPKVTP